VAGDRHLLGAVWSSAGARPFRSVGRLYQPSAITIGATILSPPSRPHLHSRGFASWLLGPWLEGTRLAEPAGCSAPNAGWHRASATGNGKAWNAAFGAAAWCCSDYSAGWCWRAGALASCQPAFIPQEERQPGARRRGAPVVPPLAQHADGWWRRSARWWPKKSWWGRNFYAGRFLRRQRPKQRHLFFLRLQPLEQRGQRHKTATKPSPTAGGGPNARNRIPEATVLLKCPSPRRIQQRGAGARTARHQRAAGSISATCEAEVRSFIAAARNRRL